jgi:hypothetical protein
LTFAFFFVLIAMSFAADKYKEHKDSKNLVNKDEVAHTYVEFKPLEIYRELAAEKAGTASNEIKDIARRSRMKDILKEYQ